MWSILLILAGTPQGVGSFDSYDSCSRTLRELRSQGVVGACVQQQDPAQHIADVMSIFSMFLREVERIERRRGE